MSYTNLFDFIDETVKYSLNNAVVFIKENSKTVLTYRELHDFSDSISHYLLSLINLDTLKSNCFVGVCCNVTYSYPCIIFGILKARLAFVPLDSMNGAQWNRQIIERLNIRLLIANKPCDFIDHAQVIKTTKILQENIDFRLFDFASLSNNAEFEMAVDVAYSIQTSGTTGSPKIIRVPHQAIIPNITELSCLFKVSTSDVIFFASPPTFDPSVIEMFLALFNGGLLLIVDDLIKKSAKTLATVLFCQSFGGVTILQTTPSFFMRWSTDSIASVVFGRSSKLRVLAFGGERYPLVSTIKKWKIPCHIDLYNLYGISEVSCWAAVSKIDRSSIYKFCHDLDITDELSNGKYDLTQCFSQPMSDTLLALRNINDHNVGEMFIGSSKRTCLIDNESMEILNSSVVFRSTGDLFQQVNGKYYFVSRKDDEIKRFGVKVNIKSIEKLAEDDPLIEQAVCVWDKIRSKLGLFLAVQLDFNLFCFKKKFRDKCPQGSWPDVIKVINSIPVTQHGKTDSRRLIQLLCGIEHFSTPTELFDSLWVRYTLCSGTDCSKGFISSGGSSFSATQFMSEFQTYTDVKYDFIIYLLQDIAYQECLKKLDYVKIVKFDSKNDVKTEDTIKTEIICKNNSSIQLKLVINWQYDLGKCVDASPSCCTIDSTSYVIIGSHSGRIAVLCSNNGTVISEICLPNRVESKACIDPVRRQFTIGCYDYCIYTFTFMCELVWTFKTKDIVKSSPTIFNNNVICGSYDKNVYCLTCDKGQLLWNIDVGGQILTQVQNIGTLIVVTTLSGYVKALQSNNGSIVWTCGLNSPIFSNFLLCDSVGVFAGVEGTINWISLDSGQKVMEFKAEGNIFSSLVLKDDCLLFGTTEGLLYHISFKSREVIWKIKLDSRLISAPLIISHNISSVNNLPNIGNSFIFIVSTKGCAYVIDLKTGLEVTSKFLPGEVYSSPSLILDNILFGCRDNNVYSMSLSDK